MAPAPRVGRSASGAAAVSRGSGSSGATHVWGGAGATGASYWRRGSQGQARALSLHSGIRLSALEKLIFIGVKSFSKKSTGVLALYRPEIRLHHVETTKMQQ